MRATETTTARSRLKVGLPGRMIGLATVAGGIAAGGFAVGIAGLLEHTSGHALLKTALANYIIGAIFGAVTGGLAGYLGREDGTDGRTAFRQIGFGLLLTIPFAVLGFMVAGWISLAAAAAYLRTGIAIGGSVAGAVVGAIIILLSLDCGWECFCNALRRARARLR